MRIIARGTLRDFWEQKEYRDSEQPLKSWFSEASKAEWRSFNEIKQQYSNASIVGNDRVVFNIKGNSYRLIVAVNFSMNIVYIRFIGTHIKYDKIKVEYREKKNR